jgi:hypothetical protein
MTLTSQLRGPCIVGPQNKMAALVYLPTHFLILQTMPENRIRKHASIACTVGKCKKPALYEKARNLYEMYTKFALCGDVLNMNFTKFAQSLLSNYRARNTQSPNL